MTLDVTQSFDESKVETQTLIDPQFGFKRGHFEPQTLCFGKNGAFLLKQRPFWVKLDKNGPILGQTWLFLIVQVIKKGRFFLKVVPAKVTFCKKSHFLRTEKWAIVYSNFRKKTKTLKVPRFLVKNSLKSENANRKPFSDPGPLKMTLSLLLRKGQKSFIPWALGAEKFITPSHSPSRPSL